MSAITALKNRCGSVWQWIKDRRISRQLRDSPGTVWPKCLVALLVPALIAAGYFGYRSLPAPEVRIVLHASTEMVLFRVVDSRLSAFRVAGMRAFAKGSNTGDCVMGVIQPAEDVTVEYALSGGKPAISLLPSSKQTAQPGTGSAQLVGHYHDETDRIRPLNAAHRILSDESCKGIPPQRFPILGSAEFGREYSIPTATLDPMRGALTDAKLTFYGKSPSLFLFLYPSIYEWKKLDVPGGSRIGALTDAGDGAEPDWQGLAQFESGKGKAVYIVDASTDARGIRLTIPGVADQDSQIVFEKFSPLTSDPNWIALQLYFGFGVWLIVKFFGFWNWLGKRIASKNATD
jgi:hypothetical protein